MATSRAGDVDADWAGARLDLVGAAYEAFGRSLTAFAAAGCYRYLGHPDNFVLTEDGRARLVDLDSSRPIEELPADVGSLQVVRDAMSGLYNLAVAFVRPDAVRDIPDDLLVAANPFGRFLRGRYPDVQSCRGEGRGVAELIVEARRRLRPFNDQIISDRDRGGALQRHLQHDQDLLFCTCFRICHRLHARSEAAQRAYPSPFTDDALEDRLLRFAGRSRFERAVRVGSTGFSASG